MWERNRCRARIEAPEAFDQGGIEPALVARHLADLAKVNRYLLGTRSVLAHVAPLLADGHAGPLRVLDLGCGGGEVLRALATRARQVGRPLLGTGVDRNPAVVSYARRRAEHLPELSWVCADARALSFPPGRVDLVISTTMLHHFSPAEAVEVLRAARALTGGWVVISDLVRSSGALLAFRLFSFAAGFHQISREDGFASLRRAYRPEELAELARAAGLTNFRVYRHPFSRMTLVCGPEVCDEDSLPGDESGLTPPAVGA